MENITVDNVAKHLVQEHGFFWHEVSGPYGRSELTLLRDHGRLHSSNHIHSLQTVDDTKLENWFDCYCVCHSLISSCSICKHCCGINQVGLFHEFGIEMLESVSDREKALIEIIRNERKRWYEIREYAQENADHPLLQAMDEASKKYAERNKNLT